jgi:hypothetical protein
MDSNFSNVQGDFQLNSAGASQFSDYPTTNPKASSIQTPSYDTTSVEPVTYQNESSSNALFNNEEDDDFASVTPISPQNELNTNTYENTNFETQNTLENNVEEYTALDQNNINITPEIPSSFQNEANVDFNAYESTNNEQIPSLNVDNGALTSDYQMNSLQDELVEQGTEVSNINYSLRNNSTISNSISAPQKKIIITVPVKKTVYVQRQSSIINTPQVPQVSQVSQVVPVAPMPQIVPIVTMPQVQFPQMQFISMPMAPVVPFANNFVGSTIGSTTGSSIYQNKVYIKKI